METLSIQQLQPYLDMASKHHHTHVTEYLNELMRVKQEQAKRTRLDDALRENDYELISGLAKESPEFWDYIYIHGIRNVNPVLVEMALENVESVDYNTDGSYEFNSYPGHKYESTLLTHVIDFYGGYSRPTREQIDIFYLLLRYGADPNPPKNRYFVHPSAYARRIYDLYGDCRILKEFYPSQIQDSVPIIQDKVTTSID